MLNTLNELAETNRLFRLKYGVHNYGEETPKQYIDRTKKDWSDQA